MMAEIDTHDPPGMAAYLRERARVNRELADIPVDQWPRYPDVARHVALRFDQAADMIDRLQERIEILARQLAQSCDDARSDPEFGGCPLRDRT